VREIPVDKLKKPFHEAEGLALKGKVRKKKAEQKRGVPMESRPLWNRTVLRWVCTCTNPILLLRH
jgi:hypothetical protein